jgi:hypothetical protein
MAFTGNYTCDTFKSGLLAGSFDFAAPTADVYKIALYTETATLDASTTASTSTGEVIKDGYTAGGQAITPSVGILDGVSFLSFTNPIWNGAITARGALVYKVGGSSLFVLDFGSDKTSTNTFTVQFPAATNTSAIIRIS